jgi:hypothetical protein
MIELQGGVMHKGRNVSFVSEGPKNELILGLYDQGVIKLIGKDVKQIFQFEIDHPSDIHVVHSKLIVRNDKGIWLADPSTKLVWKIMDAGGN